MVGPNSDRHTFFFSFFLGGGGGGGGSMGDALPLVFLSCISIRRQPSQAAQRQQQLTYPLPQDGRRPLL